MEKQSIAENVIKEAGGIAKTADFIAAGLMRSDISNLCNNGYINRIRHGYYQLSDDVNVSEEKLLKTLLPEGIVCVEAALFHYGYSDFSPREWTVAVPRTVSRTKLKIDILPLKIYYIQNNLYDLGETTENINGVLLNIYDRERTICDCFKYRTKLDSEIFNKAVNAYVADDKKNLVNLSVYAKKLKVYKKVTELMEVLLNA